MADEVATEVAEIEYTTVQLRRDLHKGMRFLALQRDTNVKTEVELAVLRYLEQDAAVQHQLAAVAQ